jgi:hypothetical protein
MIAREQLVVSALALGAVFHLGCLQGDVGAQCTLQKRNPDGGRPVNMTAADITAEGQDIISLGAQGCEDFICVRDLGESKPADPNTVLLGYCTHACRGTGTLQCGGVNNDPARPYECRPLLLDRDTLAALCAADPPLCDRYFGVERSSNFCARGLTNPGQ